MILKKSECKNPEKDEFLRNFSWLQSFAWVFLNLYYNFWGMKNLQNFDILGLKNAIFQFLYLFESLILKIK